MNSVLVRSLPGSTQIAVVAFCALTVGFLLWFLIGLLLEDGKMRKTRVQSFPIRSSTPIIPFGAKPRDSFVPTPEAGHGDNLHILPVPNKTGGSARRISY